VFSLKQTAWLACSENQRVAVIEAVIEAVVVDGLLFFTLIRGTQGTRGKRPGSLHPESSKVQRRHAALHQEEGHDADRASAAPHQLLAHRVPHPRRQAPLHRPLHPELLSQLSTNGSVETSKYELFASGSGGGVSDELARDGQRRWGVAISPSGAAPPNLPVSGLPPDLVHLPTPTDLGLLLPEHYPTELASLPRQPLPRQRTTA